MDAKAPVTFAMSSVIITIAPVIVPKALFGVVSVSIMVAKAPVIILKALVMGC